MSRTMVGLLAVTTLAVGACGSSTKYSNQPKPALPVNLTVYINDKQVSVSPASIGAGPVVFEVTNQSSKAESLAIASAGQSLASTGPITPQATAQVSVNLSTPGDYTVSTSTGPATDASLSAPTAIQAAVVHVGAPRASSGSTLLSP